MTQSSASLKNALRWLALLPLAYLAWLSVLVVGAFTTLYLERALCPENDRVSGYCDNESIQNLLEWPAQFFIGLSALAVILTATYLAPRAKITTAWLALLVGACFAFGMAGVVKESIIAIVFGALTALAVTVRAKRVKG